MAKIDLSSKLKSVADSVKNTAAKVDIQGMADSVKDAASKIDVQGMADSVKKAASKIDVEGMTEAVKDVAQKAEKAAKESAEKAVDSVKKKAEEKKKEKQEAEEKNAIETPVINAVSSINAVKIFYYLTAVDGNITKEESDTFELIGKEIDPNFESHKEKIIDACKEQLAKVIDDADYYDAVQDGVEMAILGEQQLDYGYVTSRLLVWDLLTIAYSDDVYDDTERKLMKYIVRKLNIPRDVFLEMENGYLTISDIEKEIEWVKTTDRPYLTIESQVKELEKRRQNIFESIKALICL